MKSGVDELSGASGQLSDVSGKISAHSEQTSETTQAVSAASEEMNTNMSTIASATEQTSANIQMVVTAAEEMSSTIQEIANNTAKGSDITLSAVSNAQDVSEKVNKLGRAATIPGRYNYISRSNLLSVYLRANVRGTLKSSKVGVYDFMGCFVKAL